jgi:hypothetical protein
VRFAGLSVRSERPSGWHLNIVAELPPVMRTANCHLVAELAAIGASPRRAQTSGEPGNMAAEPSRIVQATKLGTA